MHAVKDGDRFIYSNSTQSNPQTFQPNVTQNVINTDPTQVTQPNVQSGCVLLLSITSPNIDHFLNVQLTVSAENLLQSSRTNFYNSVYLILLVSLQLLLEYWHQRADERHGNPPPR